MVRSEIEVLPGQRTPVLAYAVESGGKKFLNPALLARQGDQMRVKLINRIDQPTVIHWHGLSVDSRNDGNGLHVVAPGQQAIWCMAVADPEEAARLAAAQGLQDVAMAHRNGQASLCVQRQR